MFCVAYRFVLLCKKNIDTDLLNGQIILFFSFHRGNVINFFLRSIIVIDILRVEILKRFLFLGKSIYCSF